MHYLLAVIRYWIPSQVLIDESVVNLERHPQIGMLFSPRADEQIRTAYPAHSSARSQRVAPEGASFCFLPH